MDFGLFAIFLAACGTAASTGSLFPPGPWYQELEKPPWTPPNWLFPVAWTVIYIFLAIAAARIAPQPGAAYALALWALQIALNTLWTPVFFGLHRKFAGLVIICCLWVVAMATLIAAWRVDTLAGILLIPYVIWLSYAATLNAYIVRNNPG